AVVARLQQVELELERDLRLEPHVLPRSARLPKGVPCIPGRGLAVELDVRDPDQDVGLPSRPERLAIEHRLDVVQASVELGPWDREDLLVMRERIDADTERRHPRRGPVSEEVLPPFETVDVRVEES